MAERTITDEEAMTRLHAALTGVEWDASMWDIVSDVIIATGREIASPDDVDDDDEPEGACPDDPDGLHHVGCGCE